ncbi:hypothetical protein KCU95_g13538, partial [Aureobasidium melanogenum]
MKNYQIQQPHRLAALQEMAGSFLVCGLSAVASYLFSRGILDYIEFAIQRSEIVFAMYFEIGKFVCGILLQSFVICVLLQKLMSSFQSSLLPVVKLVIEALNTGKQDEKQDQSQAQCETLKAEHPPKRQPQDQANFNREYQAWRNQLENQIHENSSSDALSHPPAPSFLPDKTACCICCNHDVTNLQPCPTKLLQQSKPQRCGVQSGP